MREGKREGGREREGEREGERERVYRRVPPDTAERSIAVARAAKFLRGAELLPFLPGRLGARATRSA